MAEFEIETDDLAPEAILKRLSIEHDGVKEYLDSLEAGREEVQPVVDAAEKAAEELDTNTEDIASAVGMVVDERDELAKKVAKLEEPIKQDHVDFIVARTDRFGEEGDLIEEDLDSLKEKRDLVEDLSSEVRDQTANPGSSTDGADTTTKTRRHGYVRTPWA